MSIPLPGARPKYLLLAPWVVTPGSGVNGVILGLAAAMRHRYDPVIVVTGWVPPPTGQLWLKMPTLSGPWRNAVGYAIHFIPIMLQLNRKSKGAIAINIHFVGLESLPVIAARKLGLCPRVILSVHGADITEALNSKGWRAALYRFMFGCADTVVACSSALAQTVQKVNPKANVVSVWNAISWPEASSDLRPVAVPYIICVAAFVKKKAHDILLPAFHLVIRHRPEMRLVLIGNEGPERQGVEEMVRSLGLEERVTIMCDVKPEVVFLWMKHAECLVLPSRDEPFGIALLEAGALGTPVVATSVGGIPEFVTNGVCGILCNPDNVDDLANAILATLQNPTEAMARAKVFQDRVRVLTWARTFDEYETKALVDR